MTNKAVDNYIKWVIIRLTPSTVFFQTEALANWNIDVIHMSHVILSTSKHSRVCCWKMTLLLPRITFINIKGSEYADKFTRNRLARSYDHRKWLKVNRTRKQIAYLRIKTFKLLHFDDENQFGFCGFSPQVLQLSDFNRAKSYSMVTAIWRYFNRQKYSA